MSYKSPIELWCDDFVHNIAMQIQENNEMQIMASINQYVSVDKEELIKALNYDRQQYKKGYADAKAEYQRPQGEWAFDEKGYFYCDQCGKHPHDQYATTDFCPNCGAKMVSSENN